jgi:hypothetical protein
MGDVYLVDELLQHHDITTCQVGCPSTDSVGGMGKDKIADYLGLIQSASSLQGASIDGLLIIGDADKSHTEAQQELSAAITTAGYPLPSKPFEFEVVEFNGKPVRVGMFIIPGKDRDGTLEHLLLDAVREKSSYKETCIDTLMACIGPPDNPSANQLAKMKVSILVGASCKRNAFASAGLALKDKNNPVPIDSASLNPLAEFLKLFIQPL